MNSLSRRVLLRRLSVSAGGLALLPLMSRLTRANPGTTPRFVFILEGNCYEPITVLDPAVRTQINQTTTRPVQTTDRWWYGSYQHTSPIIVPSTQFGKTMALPAIESSGLSSQTAVLFGLSSRITGGSHSALHGVLSSSRSLAGLPGGPTIDAALGAVPGVRQSTPYDVVRLGVSGGLGVQLNYGTCAYDRNRAAPLIVDPVASYNSLFGLVTDPTTFNQRGNLLQFAQQATNTSLAAFGGSSAERAKLESYLAAVQTSVQRQSRLVAMQSQLSKAAPPVPASNPLYMHNAVLDNDPLSRFASQLQLATAALLGELTHIVVMGSGTGGDFDMTYSREKTPMYDSSTNRHALHHGSASNSVYLDTIHDVTAQQISAIVTQMAVPLQNTPDPATGGNLLDSTVIVYIGDNGEQHHATGSEFPVVLIGGGALGLKTGGRTIVYPGVDSGGSGHRQVSNLWNTLGHLAGASPFTLGTTKINFDTFGFEGLGRVAPGPLTELLA